MRLKLSLLIGIALVAPAVPALAASQPQNLAAKGKVLYLRCVACHAVSATAPRKVGPHLQGVFGREAGSIAGFNYSGAMKKSGLKWDDPNLDRWLKRPSSVVPGTSMVFAGLPNAEDRKALIAYLKKPVP
jgi:cytochrome c